MSTHNMFSWRNKKNICLLPPLTRSYAGVYFKIAMMNSTLFSISVLSHQASITTHQTIFHFFSEKIRHDISGKLSAWKK